MKTAVSIPDDVFAQAELLARERNVSRSELYTVALRGMIADDDRTTQRLNDVYRDIDPDPAMTSAARQVFAATEW